MHFDSSTNVKMYSYIATMLFGNSVLICLTIVVISYFFWNCCQKVFFIRRLNTFPGPKTLPLIGSIYHLFLKTPDEILDVLLEIAEDCPSPFQFWMGSKLFIGIYEPDQIKTILYSKSCLDKSTLYKLFPLFGMGLFTAPASIWTRIRTMTAPTFNIHMLQGFHNIFVEQSIIFTQEIEKIGLNGNEIIFLEHISKCIWRTACETMIGIKLEQNKSNQYLKAVQRMKETLKYRLQNILLFPNIIFNLTSLGRKQRKDINWIHSLVDEMIQQRTHELNNLNTTKDENNQTCKTFFDILMKASYTENFTRKEIRDIVITMLLTASDSTTVVINFVIFMLANFPEIQEKAYKELLEIYGTATAKFAPIKYNDLQHMRYLDRVIKETMRIFPLGPLIGRQVTEKLKMGEFILPKGAEIIIGIIKLHRSEKYWPNPLMFDPDRFLSERIKNYHSYYHAFSDGPRNCIGMKYAMMSVKVIIATLVRTFIFKTNKSIEIDKIKLKFDTLISTVEPLKIKIEKRYFQ